MTSAETKGKWWLVGAAWGGNPLVDRQDEKKNAKAAPLMLVAPADEEDDLMKLARKQGMNTDVRRRVFVVIMGSTVSEWATCGILLCRLTFLFPCRTMSMPMTAFSSSV